MKNASPIAILLAVFIAVASSQSLPQHERILPSFPAKPSYMFAVPVFPRTQLFKSNPDLTELSPPFGMIVEVFRTIDEHPLDKEAVIAFYREALERKGWQEGIFKREKDEPYLSMRAYIFEDLEDHTHIQIAGDFYLWVAPLDGMITIYLKQWRISSPGQATHEALQAMIKRLEEAAPKAGFRTQKVYSDGGWKTDFENEYLVDRILYVLIPADSPADLDAPPETLIVSLLSYRDAGVAVDEKTRREHERNLLCPDSSVGIKGNIVVTIQGRTTKDKCTSVLNALTRS